VKAVLRTKRRTLVTIILVALVSVMIFVPVKTFSYLPLFSKQNTTLKALPASSAESNSSSGSSNFSTSPIKEFNIPQNQSYPIGLVTDSKGNVWFGENSNTTDNIEEFIPSNQTFRSFHIPISPQLIWTWTPVFDSSGNLWFTTTNGTDIWRLDPNNGTFTAFSTDSPNTDPYALAYDSSSNQIWFTSFVSNQFGAFQLTSGGGSASLVKLYNLSVKQSSVSGNVGAVAVALDGKGNVYVSEAFASRIAKFNETTGQLENTWTLPLGSNPLGLAIDPFTNNIWFTNHATDFFGYINQTSNAITQYSTSPFFNKGYPETTLPYWIYISSSGMIWINEHTGNRIARFDPNTLTLTEFTVPTPSSEPIKLTLDNQRGLVWFSEFTGNKIGMLKQNQSLTSQISLSNTSFTLSENSVTIKANVSSASLLPLNVSSTATSVTGALEPNFTMSSKDLSSNEVSMQINRGSSLKAGTYYLTFCTSNKLPVDSCAVTSIIVEPTQTSYLDIFIAAAAVAIAFAISIYFVKRWRSRVR
jgi:streptogramin lyase